MQSFNRFLLSLLLFTASCSESNTKEQAKNEDLKTSDKSAVKPEKNISESNVNNDSTIIKNNSKLHLRNCYINFGSPDVDDHWEGEHILFATLEIHYLNTFIKVRGEMRHQPIRNHVVQIYPVISEEQKSKIFAKDITKIVISLLSRRGDHDDEGGGNRFRVEGVLEFPNSTYPEDASKKIVIGTGYNDPAEVIYVLSNKVQGPDVYSWKRAYTKTVFLDASYLNDRTVN